MSTNLLPPTWGNQDLPTLIAAVRLTDEEGRAEASRVAQESGLDLPTTHRALRRLNHQFLVVDFVNAWGGEVLRAAVTDVLPQGRVTSGQWPDSERLAAEVVAQLQQTGEKKSKTKNFLRGAGSEFSTMLGAAVGSALKAQGLGF
ncbi:MAG: hypothetical protein E7G28_10050 [Cutibacterium avidum]|nr:hypothetical protein [Cutibacterium avidum]